MDGRGGFLWRVVDRELLASEERKRFRSAVKSLVGRDQSVQ